MKVKGKVAIVTGAAQGMGEAIALRFAQDGAEVAVVDINQEGAEQTAQKARELGVRAQAFCCDVTVSAQVYECVQAIINFFGQVDVLVNNAGWDKVEPFVKSTQETWEKVIGINFWGPVTFCHAVIPHFIERNCGSIVNVSSDAGRAGSSGEAVYSGAKGGIIAFSKTLARETARKQINVNTVCPGPTMTPMLKGLQEVNPKIVEAYAKATPLGRVGMPEDIAAAVVFLGSDDAKFITGQTLSVSGGMTMM